MPEISYESIQPLVAEAKQNGGQMECLFRCPNSGLEVEAQGSLSRGDGVKNLVQSKVKRHVFYSLRRTFLHTLRGLIGYNVAGNAASEISASLMTDAQQKLHYSESDKHDAIVKAFKRVQSKFEWDGEAGMWTGKSARIVEAA